MLHREIILETFHKALSQMRDRETPGRITPRAVAVRAHKIYCAALGEEAKKPALVTFRKFVAGKTALPEIVSLLETENVRPVPRVPLDRERVKAVFQEAVGRLESRILIGRAKPLDVVRRAYELYTRDVPEGGLRPSRLTFQKLVYGKAGDVEIQTLLTAALKK